MIHVVLEPRAGFDEGEHEGRVDPGLVIDSKQIRHLSRLRGLVVDVVALEPGWCRAPINDIPPPTPELVCASKSATTKLHVGHGLAETLVPLDELWIHLSRALFAIQVDPDEIEWGPIDGFESDRSIRDRSMEGLSCLGVRGG